MNSSMRHGMQQVLAHKHPLIFLREISSPSHNCVNTILVVPGGHSVPSNTVLMRQNLCLKNSTLMRSWRYALTLKLSPALLGTLMVLLSTWSHYSRTTGPSLWRPKVTALLSVLGKFWLNGILLPAWLSSFLASSNLRWHTWFKHLWRQGLSSRKPSLPLFRNQSFMAALPAMTPEHHANSPADARTWLTRSSLKLATLWFTKLTVLVSSLSLFSVKFPPVDATP